MALIKLQMLSPIFAVADLAAALEFYRSTLGFEVAWVWGTPPDIAAVTRDGIEITLTHRPDDPVSGTSRASVRVSDVDAYYAQVIAHGARILVPIADRAYGLRDFRMADPCGNELNIGQVLESSQA